MEEGYRREEIPYRYTYSDFKNAYKVSRGSSRTRNSKSNPLNLILNYRLLD